MPNNPDNLIGKSLNRGEFQITNKLGQGGMGDVYRVRRNSDGLPFAAKLIVPTVSPSDKFAFMEEGKEFLQEGLLVQTFRNEHVIALLSVGVDPELVRFYMIMPEAKESLKEQIPIGTKISPELAFHYALQAADGLQYAHEGKVMHLDVKPGNLLITHQGKLVVSDFGIARRGHDSNTAELGKVSGTTAYMPQEQVLGKPSYASDQYALAVSVYQWLAGKLPFYWTNLTQIVSEDRIPQALSDLVDRKFARRAEAIDIVLQKGLAKKPEDRYPTIQAFAQTLDAIVSETTTEKPQAKVFPGAKLPEMIKMPQLSDQNTLIVPDIDVQEKKSREKMIAKLSPIAESLIQTGNREKALEVIDEVLKLDPTFEDMLLRKGQILGELGKFQEAISILDMLPSLPLFNLFPERYFSKKGTVLMLYGNELVKNGDLTDAIDVYDEVISLYNQPWPQQVEAHYKRTGLRRHNNLRESLGRYDSNQQYREPFEKKALVLYKMGRYEESLNVAEELFRYMRETEPSLREYKYDDTMVTKGKRRNFMRVLTLVQDDGTYPEMSYLHSNTLLQLGRYTEALSALHLANFCGQGFQFVGDSPEPLEIKEKLGWVYEKLGKYREAVITYTDILKTDPNNLHALDRKGNSLLILGTYDEAEQEFERLTNLSPTDGNAWRCKGLACENQKKYEEALAAYDKALGLMPINKGLLTRKMEALTQLQRPTEALEVYKQIQNLPKK